MTYTYKKGGIIFMENVFNIRYNTKLDRLEIPKERKVMRIFKFIQKHKFISIVSVSFIALSTINFYLIYSFVKVLENV